MRKLRLRGGMADEDELGLDLTHGSSPYVTEEDKTLLKHAEALLESGSVMSGSALLAMVNAPMFSP